MPAFGVQVPLVKVPYRLLLVTKTPDTETPRRINYFVSIEAFVDSSAVERLICDVITNEKPPVVPEIGVGIYQGLERLSTADLVLGLEPKGHDLALYLWSFGKGTLSILRDPQGARLTPFRIYEFDHMKSCTKQ